MRTLLFRVLPLLHHRNVGLRREFDNESTDDVSFWDDWKRDEPFVRTKRLSFTYVNGSFFKTSVISPFLSKKDIGYKSSVGSRTPVPELYLTTCLRHELKIRSRCPSGNW